MNPGEPGKTVLGQDWPLEEKAVSKEELIVAYIACGKPSAAQVGIHLGQDRDFYYIVRYLLDRQKVVLLQCAKKLFENEFPSAEHRQALRNNLPKQPPQPVRLQNNLLDRIVRERSIVRFSSPPESG